MNQSARAGDALDRHLAARAHVPVRMSPTLHEALAHDAKPAARRPAWVRASAVLVGAAALVGLSDAFATGTAPVAWAPLGLTAALFAALVGVVFYRGPLGLGLAPAARWGAALGVAAVFFAANAYVAVDLAPPGDHDHPADGALTKLLAQDQRVGGSALRAVEGNEPRHEMPTEGTAAGHAVLIAGLVGVLFAAAGRRTVPVAPSSTGASAGVAAGLVGAMALQAQGFAALPLAPSLPVAAGACVGALLGRQMFSP